MKWTTDAPTLVGYYWIKSPNGHIWIGRVKLEYGGGLYVDKYNRKCKDMPSLGYLFAGPIPPPENS